MNANRDPKQHPDSIELPVPWPRDSSDQVTPEERAELTAQLRARSAFAD